MQGFTLPAWRPFIVGKVHHFTSTPLTDDDTEIHDPTTNPPTPHQLANMAEKTYVDLEPLPKWGSREEKEWANAGLAETFPR